MKNIFKIFWILLLISACTSSENEVGILKESQKMLELEALDLQSSNKDIKARIYKYVIACGSRNSDAEVVIKLKLVNRVSADLLKSINILKIESRNGFEKIEVIGKKVQEFDSICNSQLSIVNRGYEEEGRLDSVDLYSYYQNIFYNKDVLIFKNNLSAFKVRVLRIQNDFSYGFSRQLGTCCFAFDMIYGILIPESQIVEEGMYYKAQIMLSTRSPFSELTVDGKEIDSVDNEGRHIYTFKAALKRSADDSTYICDTTACPRYWNGTIRYQNQYGEDTTYNIRQKYFIRNPNRQCK